MTLVERECFSYLKSQLSLQNSVRFLILAEAKPAWKPLANFIRKVPLGQLIQYSAVQCSVKQYSTVQKKKFYKK